MCFRCGNTCQLSFMMALVAAYFFVELIVGYSVNSLALVADAFHMLSDFLALAVGIIATRISKWPRSSKNTFGWQRADVMGSLINTVVLITLCTKILMDAIKRFITPEIINQKDARMIVFVGVGGLVINILGLIIMGAHSHAGEGTTVEVSLEDIALSPGDNGSEFPTNNIDHLESGNAKLPELTSASATKYEAVNNQNVNDLECETKASKSKKAKHNHSMNMHAVFLHVLADFFGSIIVVISGLIIWLVPGEPANEEALWKVYIDPGMSVLMVAIILYSTIPLTHKAALILLQSVPNEVCLRKLKQKMENIDGIHKIHDLHVWRLQSNCIIGTVHIRCVNLQTPTDYLFIARSVKQLFHEFGIHCTTIQPEFVEIGEDQNPSDIDFQACVIDCGPNRKCQSSTCCPNPSNSGATTMGSQLAPGDTSSSQPVSGGISTSAIIAAYGSESVNGPTMRMLSPSQEEDEDTSPSLRGARSRVTGDSDVGYYPMDDNVRRQNSNNSVV